MGTNNIVVATYHCKKYYFNPNICNFSFSKLHAPTVVWFKKTRFWGNQLLFHFLNLYVEKKALAKAVVCAMIFNTASMMTNLSLNRQNRLFFGLLIGFLVFHPIKISFVKPEASSVNKFMKQRNEYSILIKTTEF